MTRGGESRSLPPCRRGSFFRRVVVLLCLRVGRVRLQRERDGVLRADARFALDTDGAAQRLDDRTGDVEPDAEAPLMLSRSRALEAIEHVRQARRIDPNPVILDDELGDTGLFEN